LFFAQKFSGKLEFSERRANMPANRGLRVVVYGALGLLLIFVQLLVAHDVRADEFDTFTVNENTNAGVINPGNLPVPAGDVDEVTWQILAPSGGLPETEFFADEPVIFQALGINPISPSYGSTDLDLCPGGTASCGYSQTLLYPTSLPPGIDVTSTIEVPIPTPEPATLVLLGTGIVGLTWLRKRSSRKV
jgi:PEP-CTERM motif